MKRGRAEAVTRLKGRFIPPVRNYGGLSWLACNHAMGFHASQTRQPSARAGAKYLIGRKDLFDAALTRAVLLSASS